jgi:RNA polymerase sigma-70 factor (ECF subfamily)
MSIENRELPLNVLDERSFEKLFRQYFPPLISFSMNILRDEDDAREVVQKVFLGLWEKREELDLSSSLKSYLFTSVHNRSLNIIRDKRKFQSTGIPDEEGTFDVSLQIEAIELEEKIMDAIALLPEKCREVFELSRFEGLKYSEIADRLGISVKTVENQISKALKILREKLLRYLSLLMWFLLNAMN